MFTYFNVGGFGSESDGGIFQNCSIGNALETGEIYIPPAEPIYGSDFNVPYVFLADSAFPLRTYLMTPYGGRHLTDAEIFHNRELSRGRCLIENSFGVLAGRWQVLLKRIRLHPVNVDKVILAVVLLHNMLLINARSQYMPDDYADRYVNGEHVDGRWRIDARGGLQPLPNNIRMGARNAAAEPILIRNNIKSLIFNKHNNNI